MPGYCNQATYWSNLWNCSLCGFSFHLLVLKGTMCKIFSFLLRVWLLVSCCLVIAHVFHKYVAQNQRNNPFSLEWIAMTTKLNRFVLTCPKHSDLWYPCAQVPRWDVVWLCEVLKRQNERTNEWIQELGCSLQARTRMESARRGPKVYQAKHLHWRVIAWNSDSYTVTCTLLSDEIQITATPNSTSARNNGESICGL